MTAQAFGEAAFSGIIASDEYQSGKLQIALLVTLSSRYRDRTIGFSELPGLVDLADRHISVTDGTLEAHASQISEVVPDYLLVVGWSRLVVPAVLDIPSRAHGQSVRHGPNFGPIGMHPALLPVGRGRAPIPWTIIYGLRRTGLSVFHLDDGADTGDIVFQIPFDIPDDADAGVVYERFRGLHWDAGKRLAALMATGTVPAVPQDESLATTWRRRTPDEGRIDFRRSTADTVRQVRALVRPFPGAFVLRGGARIRVNRAKAVGLSGSEPGLVVESCDDRVIVTTGDGAVELSSFEPPDGVHLLPVGSLLDIDQ